MAFGDDCPAPHLYNPPDYECPADDEFVIFGPRGAASLFVQARGLEYTYKLQTFN